MDVLGHNYVAVNTEAETSSNTFQREFEDQFGFDCVQEWTALITGEGQEVGLSGFVKPFQPGGHGGSLLSHPTQAKKRLEWGTVSLLSPAQAKGGLNGAPSSTV